ncbi:hypothetical protein Tco_0608741 [Tanacetum coccineum]
MGGWSGGRSSALGDKQRGEQGGGISKGRAAKKCISTATAICIPFGLHHDISEHLHPVGLHHELKPLDLPFGNNFILSLRDELFDMEAVSRIFEEDIDIVNDVQCHIKNGSDMALPSTLSKDIAKEMDEAYSMIDEAPQSNIHVEVKTTCYSDDSDSKIFRVKRRSYKATT